MKIINNNKKFLLTFLFLLFITNLSATKVVLPPYYTNLDIYKNDPDSEKERKNAIAKYHLKESSQYYQVLADRYKNKKDFTNAIRNYEYSILINNNKGYSFLKLGEIYFTQKLYQEAISYLKVASNKDFSFEFDRIKTEYLLITSYFFVQEDDNALKIINDLIQEYKLSVDENINNLSAVNTDYYSPAYFLKNLYNRNHKLFDKDDNLNTLQKSLELGFKKEFIDYFLYEYYKSKNLLSVAFEYLTQAKMVSPNIEHKIIKLSWIRNYDITKIINFN